MYCGRAAFASKACFVAGRPGSQRLVFAERTMHRRLFLAERPSHRRLFLAERPSNRGLVWPSGHIAWQIVFGRAAIASQIVFGRAAIASQIDFGRAAVTSLIDIDGMIVRDVASYQNSTNRTSHVSRALKDRSWQPATCRSLCASDDKSPSERQLMHVPVVLIKTNKTSPSVVAHACTDDFRNKIH